MVGDSGILNRTTHVGSRPAYRPSADLLLDIAGPRYQR